MNSSYTIYLMQKPEELAEAEANGYIDNSDGKIDIIRNLETVHGQYSQIGISTPDGLVVEEFMVDKVTEKIYSTQAAEVEYLMEARKRGVPLLDAINDLISGKGVKQ